MPGLGTQALKPWGLKHQAADNDVLYQSLFSKPITEVGAQKRWLYHPCLSGRSPFLVSQSPRTETGNASRTAANVTQKSNAVEETLHLYRAAVSKEKDFDCVDQSVHILTYKTKLDKMLGAPLLHKIHQKAGYMSFKFCQNKWQMCTIIQVGCCGNRQSLQNIRAKTAHFSPLLPCQ